MLACRGSPTSQKICFRHVKAARNMPLATVLEEDFRLLHHMCHISHDFVEGIRAKLIEKDNNARWKPASVDEVSFADYCNCAYYMLVCRMSHDFSEGIRAKLIEKDNNACWEPA